MSNELRQRLDAILAAIGLNDGANKGFWRIQPRDDEGQWIEMGGDVLFRFRTGDGNLVVATARGIYVGPTGKPGRARILVREGNEAGLEPGVYDLDSRNLTQVKAFIPKKDGETEQQGQRLDKFGKPVKTLEDAKLPTQEELEANAVPATEEDERLARGELTPEERSAEQDGRSNSPVADMPAGFEAENPEEVKNLLRESGVDPDEFDSESTTPSTETAEPAPAKAERAAKPKAYGIRNFNEFRDLPDGTILDEYERAQFYPSPEDYRGANGPVWRSFIKQDGKWYLLGKNGKPKGQPLKRAEITDKLNSGTLTDRGAGFKIDENGKKVPAWADEMEPAPEAGAPEITRSAVNDAYVDAFDGKVPNLDSLIEETKKEDSLSAARERIVEKPTLDLNRGDIIVSDNGEEMTVIDIKLGNAPQGIPAQITVQKADGSTEDLTPLMTDRLKVVSGRKAKISRPPVPPEPEETPSNDSDSVLVDKVAELMELEAEGISDIDLSSEIEEVLDMPQAELDAAKLDDLISRVRAHLEEKSKKPETSPEINETGEPSEGTSSTDFTATPEGLQPANFPPKDRMDDGSEFELPKLTDEEFEAARSMQLSPINDPDGTPAKYLNEYNELVDAEDPFAMLSALAKIYPNAKFTEDGALVLHRQKDKDGRIFELRANNSAKKAIVYSMRWTDPATGDFKEYQHKDDRHAITALFREDNGPEGLLDRLLGRVDRKGKDWGLPENYKFGNTKFNREDSLFRRLKWFMSGTGDRKKMEELADNAVRLAGGRQAVYHKNKGTIKNSEMDNLWDIFANYYNSGETKEDRDEAYRDDLYHSLYGVFGRAPLNDKAHVAYMRALRKEFKRQFPSATAKMNRSFGGILTSASWRMRGIYSEPDANVRSIRYASKDRTRAIERGMVVEYINNVDEKAIVRVDALVANTNATPNNSTSYDYGDYVIITDNAGNKIKINALKLRILADQKTSLTRYKPNLRGEALVNRRRELGKYGVEGENIAASRPIPGQDSVISDPAPEPKLVDDFIVGEMLYTRDGRPLGIIKSLKPVTSKNGDLGVSFLFTKPDGTEGSATYRLGTELKPKKA